MKQNTIALVYDFDGTLTPKTMQEYTIIPRLKLNSDKFCYQILKKQKIAITPGHYFGKEWKNYIRISMVIEHTKFKRATDLLFKFINKKRA